METPDFCLNSFFYAPDNGDEVEVGVQILVSVCIHYNFSASSSSFDGSYFLTQYTPNFSLLQHKTNHTHKVYDTTKQQHYAISFPVGAPHRLECPAR